jgi:hypothetical protein
MRGRGAQRVDGKLRGQHAPQIEALASARPQSSSLREVEHHAGCVCGRFVLRQRDSELCSNRATAELLALPHAFFSSIEHGERRAR